MSRHYHMVITIDQDELDIARGEFRSFLEQGGELTVKMIQDGGEEPSAEVQNFIKRLILRALTVAYNSRITEVQ